MKKTITLLLGVISLSAFSAQLPSDYKVKSAKDKQALIFQKSVQNPYSETDILRQSNPSAFSLLKLLSVKRLAKSFTNPNDEFYSKKIKLIHTYGAVAKVKFNITNSTKYTGLFQSGAFGIIRLSLAKLGLPYTPGIALKLFVDGKKSQNMFAMYSLDGQKNNYNFFENNFESKIDEPKSGALQIIARKFKKALVRLGSDHKDPTLQSSTDLAAVTSNGKAVEQPIVPFSLVFEPTAEAQMSSAEGNLLLRVATEQYSKDLILYNVYTRSVENAPKELLGEIILESRFISNEYGDKKLFFQHNID